MLQSAISIFLKEDILTFFADINKNSIIMLDYAEMNHHVCKMLIFVFPPKVQLITYMTVWRVSALWNGHSYQYWYTWCHCHKLLHPTCYTTHLPGRILSTSNRIHTRGQQQKRQSCILPVDSCHGTIIVISDCTIVT